MKKVWKFSLAIDDRQVLRMPVNAQILSVQAQKGSPVLWAIVDYETDVIEERIFITHGTGHSVSEEAGAYIGTYQLRDGDLVFHVFEKK